MTASASAITAADVARRYETFFAEGRLTQRAFQRESEGRALACALGVISPDVKSVKDCPSTVMPRWLAQLTPYFFDRQSFEDAAAWGRVFYAQLARLDGQVPFSVIHDWRGNVLMPMRIAAWEARGRDTSTAVAVQALHHRALAGDNPDRDEWRAALKVYAKTAYADADAYAYAYADAYAYAYADADAYAYADADADADADALKLPVHAAIKQQADGMVACLKRVRPQ